MSAIEAISLKELPIEYVFATSWLWQAYKLRALTNCLQGHATEHEQRGERASLVKKHLVWIVPVACIWIVEKEHTPYLFFLEDEFLLQNFHCIETAIRLVFCQKDLWQEREIRGNWTEGKRIQLLPPLKNLHLYNAFLHMCTL